MDQGKIKFKIRGSGFSIKSGKGKPIYFTGTLKEAYAELKRYYEEAGSQNYTHAIAEFYGAHQMTYPSLRR